MNFVFRSMVQEYISLLHLVDVRIAYHDTTHGSYVEAPISKIHELLEGRVKDEHQQEIIDAIMNALGCISDYQDEIQSFVEKREIKKGNDKLGEYFRVKKDLFSQYKDLTGNEITVPGIITSASKNSLKTEGVIVETLLGQGESLDNYSKGLQSSEVTQAQLKNDILAAGLEILKQGERDKAEIFAKIFPRQGKNGKR